jgi:hypothetical protein
VGRQAILISHEENRNDFQSSHNRMHSATATLSIYSCSAKESAHPIMNKLFLLAFRTEFYPTYDLYPVIKDRLANPAKRNPLPTPPGP